MNKMSYPTLEEKFNTALSKGRTIKYEVVGGIQSDLFSLCGEKE